MLTEAEAMIAATGIAEQVVDEFIADVVAASPHGEGVDLPSEWQDVPTELDVDAFIAEPAFDPARFGFDLDDTALNLPGDDGWMMLGSGALETTEFSVEANDNRADAGYTVTEPDGSWLPVGGTSDLS